MAERGVDVLLVTSPPNLYYLTGFESIWYPPRAPVGVVVTAADDRLVFLDYERHETLVRETAHYDDAVFYRYEDVLDTIAETFRARGWLDGTIGLERWSQAPGAPIVEALAQRLRDGGGRVVEGDWVVDRVRLVKSPAELECVRRAAAIVDAAFADLAETLRPGHTELQIGARLDSVMADHGGEAAAIRTMVSAGPDVWCRTHAPPSRRPVEAGDVMYVDACGVFNRYHVDVCRTFAIGRDHPQARAILDATAGSVDAVRAAVRPGDPLDVAQRVAEDYVFSRFPREQVWWVGGYALGIAMPPNWVGHTYLANDAFEQFTWEPGYVTNYENVLFDRDAGFTASYMETLLMTDTGIEALSNVPRTLTVLGGCATPAVESTSTDTAAARAGCKQIPGKDCMGVGYLVAESMRTRASLEGLPLTLRKVERFEVGDATTGQPPVWSGIEFGFPESEVERVAAALAAVIEAQRWWADLRADGETFIVFAERVFRFPTGDIAASADARDYGLAVGVPAGQLDWS